MSPYERKRLESETARLEALAALGITFASKFVPWSRSRNAGEKLPSLNWKVSMSDGTGVILQDQDFMASYVHCPAYDRLKLQSNPLSVGALAELKDECETGRGSKCNYLSFLSLVLADAEAIDYPTFEEWAEAMGENPDSRIAEKSYRDCVRIGLSLRRMGEEKLDKLREVMADY